jgi:hypothetical protein
MPAQISRFTPGDAFRDHRARSDERWSVVS